MIKIPIIMLSEHWTTNFSTESLSLFHTSNCMHVSPLLSNISSITKIKPRNITFELIFILRLEYILPHLLPFKVLSPIIFILPPPCK